MSCERCPHVTIWLDLLLFFIFIFLFIFHFSSLTSFAPLTLKATAPPHSQWIRPPCLSR